MKNGAKEEKERRKRRKKQERKNEDMGESNEKTLEEGRTRGNKKVLARKY